jgi:hypothetical protein
MSYLLFAGSTYYACGGWRDFRGAFESLEDARVMGDKLIGDESDDWFHIVYENKIIERHGDAGYC